jgi:hypothetical protein
VDTASDQAVGRIFEIPKRWSASMFKGWFFVAVTLLLLRGGEQFADVLMVSGT